MSAQPSVPVGRAAYQLGEGWIPYPPSLGPLLRPEQPEVHWALVLDRILGTKPMLRHTRTRLAVARALRERLERRLRDDGPPDVPGGPKTSTLAYVTYLVPPVPCALCGRPFLRENDRRLHCSDFCRRRAADPAYGTGTPSGESCLHCGGPVTGVRSAYCSPVCQGREEERRRRERLVAGRPPVPPPGPCPTCGGPVTGRNERAVFCGMRCKWRAQKRRAAAFRKAMAR